MKGVEWYIKTKEDVYKILKTNREGIDENEVQQRINDYGQNSLPEKEPVSKWKIFVNQLKSPLVYILIFAAITSLFLSNYLDMLVITIAIFVNSALGFYLEFKASKSVSLLKELVNYRARVIRNGQEKEVLSNEVVVGDIIKIREGDRIPADAYLVNSFNLKVNEAALTGESIASRKRVGNLEKGTPLADRENMLYSGTIVVKGRAEAIVCKVGKGTELGKISSLIKDTVEDLTPLQKQIKDFSRSLIFILLFLILGIFLIGLYHDIPLFSDHSNHEEGLLNISIATAVSAVPEGLLIAITATLAVGMQIVLKRNALIRRLISAETLGSTSVICVDKTGTLTTGIMELSKIIRIERNINFEGKKNPDLDLHERKILETAVVANDALIESCDDKKKKLCVRGDSTDKALIEAGYRFNIDKRELEKKYPQISIIPFDSDLKYLATLNKKGLEQFELNIKGAPENILDFCSYYQGDDHINDLDKSLVIKIENLYKKYTKEGYRLLALAHKKFNRNDLKNSDREESIISKNLNGLTFLGFTALKDPVRAEVHETFKLTKKAGLKTVIVTGDHLFTAKSIAEEVFDEKITEPEMLEGYKIDNLSDKELKDSVRKIKIFARVEPSHKLRIVKAWQANGEVVAMSGDGINDAPAMKAADIGIALGSGTDIAKQTSDLILLDDNFNTIVAAIQQGRTIFDNIKKVILYLMSDSFSEIILIAGALAIGLPLPLLPVQILWINLITDGFPDLALIFEKGEKDNMYMPPRKLRAKILDKEMKFLIFIIGVITDILLLGLYFYLYRNSDLDIDKIRSIIFVALGIDSLFYVYSCRSLRKSIFKMNPFGNKILNLAVLLGLLLQIVAIYEPHISNILGTVPLTFGEWGLISIIGIIEIMAIEITKEIFSLYINKKNL